MASKLELNKLISKEISSAEGPAIVKELAHELLDIEMDHWGPEQGRWRFREFYEQKIANATRKSGKA